MIYTVLGAIEKEAMGVTMSHEHFKWETDEDFAYDMYFNKSYREEENAQYHEVIMPVVTHLKGLGVEAIVETSPPIGGQNIKLLHGLAKENDIHIIPCTGCNLSKHAYKMLESNFVELLSKQWIRDFEEGLDCIEGTVIRPSYIKLLLDKGPLSDVDRGMLEAAIITSQSTGLAIHCHILEALHVQPVLDLLQGDQMDMTRFLWAHADHEGNKTVMQNVLEQGAYVGIDSIQEANFEKCYELLNWVIENGYEKQVLLSEDLDFYTEQMGKNDLQCGRMFSDFLPHCKMMGISDEKIHKILTSNPSRFYNVK